MTITDLNRKAFTEETITKLDIFEEYLKAWLPVFIYNNYIREVNIFDLFAGSGTDSEGNHGSPLRIIKVIESYKKQIIDKNFIINLYLNEIEKRKFENLKKCTYSKIDEKLKDNINIKYFNKDFKSIFFDMIPPFKDKVNLMILDQNGIKQITPKVLLMLDEFSTTDFIFFISSSFLNRFGNSKEFQKYLPNMDISKLKESEYTDIHRVILEYYKEILPNNSNIKLYSFSLKKGSNIYGIIFGSKHPFGVDKFLRIAWKKNELNGEANFDIDKDRFKHSNQLVLFPWMQNLTKIEKFEKELGEFLLEEDRTNKDVYDFTLEHGHIPIHAHIVVKKLKIENKIIYSGRCCISYDKCYNHNNREIKIFKRVV